MSFINRLYHKSVEDNERNFRFWEDYIYNLKTLDFGIYADKLKVPTLVPIGSRVFFRGELKHTNEVTVALGADYFVKCSLAQAEVLRQHRIRDAESKLESYKKEKEYLENQLLLTHKSVCEKDGKEIVELFTEEEDRAWRHKHRENVREFMQEKAKEEKPKEGISDDELWNRLEELELEEELESELLDNFNEIIDKRKENSFLAKEEQMLFKSSADIKTDNEGDNKTSYASKIPPISGEKTELNDKSLKDKKEKEDENESISKLILLQQVLDKQNQLEGKLIDLKNRDRHPNKTEQDLISHLDEMEQLDELEDEMERLEDIIETEDLDSDDEDEEVKIENVETNSVKLKKGIHFADNNEDCETIEINFKHTNVDSCNEPYDPEKGIVKPSDIYEAHSSLLHRKPKSILKKVKYDTDPNKEYTPKEVRINMNVDSSDIEEYPVPYLEQEHKETIIVKDVIENPVNNRTKINTDVRPTSLFKQRRMQSKH